MGLGQKRALAWKARGPGLRLLGRVGCSAVVGLGPTNKRLAGPERLITEGGETGLAGASYAGGNGPRLPTCSHTLAHQAWHATRGEGPAPAVPSGKCCTSRSPPCPQVAP